MAHLGRDDPRRDWGYVYCVSPVAQCDDYVGVPRGGVEEAMGKRVREGEYAYLHYAHWTDGVEIYHSVRDWVGTIDDCGVGEGCCCSDKGIVPIARPHGRSRNQ